MSEAVKTRPTKQKNSPNAFRLLCKKTTPRRILIEAQLRYAIYLTDSVVNNDEEFIPIAETAWYRQMSATMTSGRYLKTCRRIADYTQARLGTTSNNKNRAVR